MIDLKEKLKEIGNTGLSADNEVISSYGNLLVQEKREELKDVREDRKARRELIEKIPLLTYIYLGIVALILLMQGFSFVCFYLSDSVLVALLGTTSVNVIGLVWLIVSHYFNKHKSK